MTQTSRVRVPPLPLSGNNLEQVIYLVVLSTFEATTLWRDTNFTFVYYSYYYYYYCHLSVVCCCFSKLKQPLVTQKSLVPVVCQLDSSQSEAVVGSSSDVASPSRSRHMSSDIDDHSSPATSPEAHADSHVPVKHPAPRGLVDALSRYFTPSDKRRSRVSLNALPHASPRSLSTNPHRSAPTADTTHRDDTLPIPLPLKRRHLKKSILARHNFWKRSNAADPISLKTCTDDKPTAADLQLRGSESPTSELSPSTCLPSESKPEVESDPSCLETIETTDKEAVKSKRSDVTVAEPSVGENARKSGDKQRKRRCTQLSSLQDSLSHLFSAEGERKRTPVQYLDSDFSFETYHPFDYGLKRVRWNQSSGHSRSQSESHDDADQVEVMESSSSTAAATLWSSASYRLSNYRLAGYIHITCLLSLTIMTYYRVATHLENLGNLEKSGILRVVREK